MSPEQGREGHVSFKDLSGYNVKGGLESPGRPIRKLLHQFKHDSWDPEAGRGLSSGEQKC